jgi:hypothetical protein
MPQQQATFTVRKKIRDDQFNVDSIDKYHLLLKLDETRLKICITDSISNRCLFLEDISIEKSLDHEGRIQVLESLFDEHAFLKAAFWKSVKCIVSSMHFTFVPAPLFDAEELESYLSLSTRYEASTESLLYYPHQNSEAVCAFSAPMALISWLSKTYPNGNLRFMHNTSPLIEGALHSTMPLSKKQLYLFAEGDQLTGIVTLNGRLEFCNIFQFHKSEELLYYTMWILKELDMDPNEHEVVLFGDVTESSDYYLILYQYIRNISFGDKPSFLKFSYVFDEVNDHKYLDLYCMHLCQ